MKAPLILLLAAVAGITALTLLDKVAGDVGLAALIGIVGGSFVPSPISTGGQA